MTVVESRSGDMPPQWQAEFNQLHAMCLTHPKLNLDCGQCGARQEAFGLWFAGKCQTVAQRLGLRNEAQP